MLLGIVVALAKESGFTRVEVQRSSRNRWLGKARLRSLERLYDENARRLGFFEPNETHRDFYLLINQKNVDKAA